MNDFSEEDYSLFTKHSKRRSSWVLSEEDENAYGDQADDYKIAAINAKCASYSRPKYRTSESQYSYDDDSNEVHLKQEYSRAFLYNTESHVRSDSSYSLSYRYDMPDSRRKIDQQFYWNDDSRKSEPLYDTKIGENTSPYFSDMIGNCDNSKMTADVTDPKAASFNCDTENVADLIRPKNIGSVKDLTIDSRTDMRNEQSTDLLVDKGTGGTRINNTVKVSSRLNKGKYCSIESRQLSNNKTSYLLIGLLLIIVIFGTSVASIFYYNCEYYN